MTDNIVSYLRGSIRTKEAVIAGLVPALEAAASAMILFDRSSSLEFFGCTFTIRLPQT